MTRLSSTTLAVLAVLVALAAAASPGVRAQALKVGVFDPQQLSEATILGRQMQGKLERLQRDKLQSIDELRKEISALQQQLSEQRLSLSSDTRNQLEINIQRRLLALEAAQDSATKEMQLELNAAKAIFEDKLLVAVESFGRDEGFQLLLDRTLVAYADGAVDVTTALIDRFDRMFPTAEDTP